MDFKVDFKVDLEFEFSSHPCKGIQDALGFWIPRRRFPDSRYWIPHFFLLELGFRVPVVGGIPDSKDEDFVFHKRICSGFRIPQAKLSSLHGVILVIRIMLPK